MDRLRGINIESEKTFISNNHNVVKEGIHEAKDSNSRHDTAGVFSHDGHTSVFFAQRRSIAPVPDSDCAGKPVDHEHRISDCGVSQRPLLKKG
jgi:predicted RNA-binding protein with PUA domain